MSSLVRLGDITLVCRRFHASSAEDQEDPRWRLKYRKAFINAGILMRHFDSTTDDQCSGHNHHTLYYRLRCCDLSIVHGIRSEGLIPRKVHSLPELNRCR